MLTAIAIALGFGFIIAVHEAAHMLVSKLFNVKVKKFAIGMGPVLLNKVIGETSYELRILPIGGFVQCDGENPLSNVKRGFFSLPWYKRALIALAGPVASFLLGYVILYFLLVLGRGWPVLLGFKQAYLLTHTVLVETFKFMAGHGQAGATVSGPVMIIKILSDSLSDGFIRFGSVLAVISLSLGIMNILPIPALDGGHVFLYTLEGLYGKKFKPVVYAVWNMLGFALLLLLLLYTVFADSSALMH